MCYKLKYIKLFEAFYWGTMGAGILPVCVNTGKILVGFRSGDVLEPYTWGTFGGKLDVIDTDNLDIIKKEAIRELEEETGYIDDITLHKAYIFEDGNFKYYNFFGVVPFEFKPDLNWENDSAEWYTYEELIKLKDKHFGLEKLLKESGNLLLSLLNKVHA